ncbi:hypothetical protein PDJAM_G00031500 [Pangasius djambal]|uniref:Uncharacterized protein n=1 Tax=Pangasius djambal TaxID=1691987 RepID=A0ACC5YQU3_9TELE|nr:hypothetical protein [Pangasius djambal]
MGGEDSSRSRRNRRKSHFPTVLLLILIHADGILSQDLFHDRASKPKHFQIVRPQLVHRRWRRHGDSAHTHTQRADPESLTYSIEIDNTPHLLQLTKNEDFLSPDFAVVSHDVHRNSVKRHREKPASCHYYGRVSGSEESLVALSACDGLRGVIFIGNKSYALEPALHASDNQHILFPLRSSQSDPFVCGVDSECDRADGGSCDHTLSMGTFLRKKRYLPQTRYVELVLVVDNLRFNFKKGNRTAVREEMVQLANLVDSYFKQLNIRIVLVGLEIFETSNPFDVEGTAGEVLGRFVEWRKKNLTSRIRNDMGQLIVGRTGAYSGGILGMAYVGSVCSAGTGGGINVFSSNALQYFSTVLAHEMGHNLGMNHDDSRCQCEGSSCIMASASTGSTLFSTCSGNDFETLVLRGGGVCLLNQPSQDSVISVAECGNGILEGTEECDCGPPEGTRFGNCGYSGSSFVPCSVANSMCGKVQCTNFDSNYPPAGAVISIEDIEPGVSCRNADFNLGSDVLDPGYVKTGTVCAAGKVCVNFGCVNSSVLTQGQKCDAERDCNGNGVCNDKFHCHCNNGWAPPNCTEWGRGGSVDSGPAQIDYSLRNGLLIFFLLVLPILVLAVFAFLYIFRRDSLNRCFRGRRSKRHRTNDANAQRGNQPSGNVRGPARPPPPTQVPPTVPQYPSAISGAQASQSHLDVQPAVWTSQLPRNGPGVPRPIPPRNVEVLSRLGVGSYGSSKGSFPCQRARSAKGTMMSEQEAVKRNRGGVQRVEGKLRASVERGDYYEAHQMYRTLFFRYTSQSKHAEARELMYNGALLFFSYNQQNSAADLSMLVLEALEKSEAKVEEEILEQLVKLFSMMDPNSPERVAFVSRALKWSTGGSGKLGHPKLHQLLAVTLWKEQNYSESRYHFLHSSDGEGCAQMLVEYSAARGFRSEVDMFVAQAVLQFLCLKNKTSASVVFTTYTQKHPSIEKGPPFVQPLLNFLWFLLLAVDGGKLTVFTVLCEQYQPSLKRDPMYNEYLDRIGQLFFGVPPKQSSSYGGLLGNLLNSLMGSGEEEEGEEVREDSSPIELD